MKRRGFLKASIGSALASLLWPWKGKVKNALCCEDCGVTRSGCKALTRWHHAKIRRGSDGEVRNVTTVPRIHCEKCLSNYRKGLDGDIHEAQVKAFQLGMVSKDEFRAHLSLP